MDDNRRDDAAKQVPIRDLKIEPEVEELLESAAMEPYLNLALGLMRGKDTGPAMAELAALPLEKRYVWRVASALKWAFADCETMNVETDRRTLSNDNRLRVFELLQHRPLQFCLFLSELFGQMLSAVKNSRVIASQSDGEAGG